MNYNICVSTISRYATSIEELAFSLYGVVVDETTISVNTTKVDKSQLDYVLPIYGWTGYDLTFIEQVASQAPVVPNELPDSFWANFGDSNGDA